MVSRITFGFLGRGKLEAFSSELATNIGQIASHERQEEPEDAFAIAIETSVIDRISTADDYAFDGFGSEVD